MPLPPTAVREELHTRRIEIRGYHRPDGLFDVEGRIVDTKAKDTRLSLGRKLLPAGSPLHEMLVRLTFDEDLLVRAAQAATEAAPHDACPEAAPAIERIVGLTIGDGWTRAVRERLGREKGCQHITELLSQMATTAMQTISSIRNNRPPRLDANGRPLKIDSCYAWAGTRELVRMRWPAHYDGPPKDE